MDELLNHPAVQAAVAPFVAALAAGIALRRTRLLGLAVIAAVVALVALSIGFSVEPITSTRKMIIATLAAGAFLPLLAWLPRSRVLRVSLAGAAALAAVWTVLRMLAQQDTAHALVHGAGAGAFAALLVDGVHGLREQPVRASAAALALGLGAAVLAFFGASIFLAQTGVAIAAAAGALLLVLMAARAPAESAFLIALPAAIVAGLVCLIAVFTGGLAAWALLPMLAVPWCARLIRP